MRNSIWIYRYKHKDRLRKTAFATICEYNLGSDARCGAFVGVPLADLDRRSAEVNSDCVHPVLWETVPRHGKRGVCGLLVSHGVCVWGVWVQVGSVWEVVRVRWVVFM